MKLSKFTYQQKEELSQWLTELGEKWVGDLVNLQALYLFRKQITSIPESIGQLTNLQYLNIDGNKLTSLPESIGQLTNLKGIRLEDNELTSLPESIGQLTNLQKLNLDRNQLTSLPESIGQLTNLQYLNITSNNITSIPESIGQLTNLRQLILDGNITDLSPLHAFIQKDLNVSFLNISNLPRRYWCKLSDWNPEWILDENNTEIRRRLIQQVGYEKIYDSRSEGLRQRLGAEEIHNWREYTLLKIDNVEARWVDYGGPIGIDIGIEPMLLLKMTCPSTKHIHILRVPPEMTSAQAAITWVNHGIHPDEIAVQT